MLLATLPSTWRKRKIHPIALLLILAMTIALCTPVFAWNLSGHLGGEAQIFFNEPLSSRQTRHSGSLVIEPEFYWSRDNGSQGILFTPFLRVDLSDAERTHGDIRELMWERFDDTWELRIGIGKVFWGVTESVHLVDIINQTDLVESVDAKRKLGQPMANLTLLRDWGTLDLFLLPGFRERTFPGPRGRLRSQLVVDTNQPIFASGAENRHIDAAIRSSGSFGAFDIGLSHFYGTSRDPLLIRPLNTEDILVPRYDLIHQTGLDMQYTHGNWLLKFEGIRRIGQGRPFITTAIGFERTFIGVADSSHDLGLLMEYLYDERGNSAGQPFEDDLFAGVRWGFNDAASSTLLLGVIRDLDASTSVYSMEGSRRLGEHWKLEMAMRFWSNVHIADNFNSLRNDDHIQINVLRFF